MKNIVVLGGSNPDVLQLLHDLANHRQDWQLIGILDDRLPKGSTVLGAPVLGSLDGWHELEASTAFVQSIVSRPQTSRTILERLRIPRERFPNLIHPTSIVSQLRVGGATMGCGNIVLQGASIQPNAVLGDFNYVNIHCTIGHDAVVGDFNSFGVAAVVTGRCRIGRECYLGSASVITNESEIGDGAFICAGTVISRSVPAGAKMLGNPPRLLPNS
jgi:sugar O-acyltransferase (sialic acid O-acetyltransferase NeuD family)